MADGSVYGLIITQTTLPASCGLLGQIQTIPYRSWHMAIKWYGQSAVLAGRARNLCRGIPLFNQLTRNVDP